MIWLTQLFEKVADKKLLSIGLVSLLIGSLIAINTNARFDGVLDMHLVKEVQPIQPFLDNIINTIILAVLLFALGKYVNSKTRFIDILNTAFICRIPFYLLPLFNINHAITTITDDLLPNIAEPDLLLQSLATPTTLILIGSFALVSILALILFAYLVFKGFKTATNLKKTVHIILLVVTVLIAEVLSKFLVYLY
ncbi:hypothetical protein [Flavobacterium sp. HSC-61S13]|uniref:hypothetical protein n=1 Tax=Flavobacterium sp. HSC-61S13 TaxID=2910963 RepID=UPI00209FE8EF|nr:hypothetical protein [Flavobacterium sp. HSC-61S13]MCP1995666.1 hypothetical protein [Flavobacterium sp. HSC-61S13]